MRHAGDRETVCIAAAVKVGGRPPRLLRRAELLRLIRDTEFRLRCLANWRDAALPGTDRYKLLQIAEPLLTALLREGGPDDFLNKAQKRRMLRRREAERREADRRERHCELWAPRLECEEAEPEPPIERPFVPLLDEICLTDIGAAWSPVAEKMPSGEWRWALPPLHQMGFERERGARRILTTQQERGARTILLARRSEAALTPSAVFGRPDAEWPARGPRA